MQFMKHDQCFPNHTECCTSKNKLSRASSSRTRRWSHRSVAERRHTAGVRVYVAAGSLGCGTFRGGGGPAHPAALTLAATGHRAFNCVHAMTQVVRATPRTF